MPIKKRISPSRRRYMDALRIATLRRASVFERRLRTLRAKEIRRVLNLAESLRINPESLADFIEGQFREDYLQEWFVSLYTSVGVPQAKETIKDVLPKKDIGEDDIWMQTLDNYARRKAGERILLIEGSARDNLIKICRSELTNNPTIGIEKLTNAICDTFTDDGGLLLWQCRRIARTESMMAMSDSADMAARSLEMPLLKTWSISGIGNTRETHEVMDGVTIEQDEPFILQGGSLMYPHDQSLGADASEIINCACCCMYTAKR